jgi:quinol monooxygenase YgiN
VTEALGLAAAYDRVAAHLVGRERELTLLLAAVAAGRDIILEGPPGTSKSTLLRAITAEWGSPLFFVEGNADLTPSKLIGHHNPARVLREDYSPDNFVDGPLLQAMRAGGFLYIDEVIATITETVARVHEEDGCELYALHQADDRLVMVEKWASADALRAHSQGAALAAQSPRLAGKLTGPAEVIVLQAAPAGDPAKGQL